MERMTKVFTKTSLILFIYSSFTPVMAENRNVKVYYSVAVKKNVKLGSDNGIIFPGAIKAKKINKNTVNNKKENEIPDGYTFDEKKERVGPFSLRIYKDVPHAAPNIFTCLNSEGEYLPTIHKDYEKDKLTAIYLEIVVNGFRKGETTCKLSGTYTSKLNQGK